MLGAARDLADGWNLDLEDVLGLILVLGVVGLYSLVFALTRRPWFGWASTAIVSLLLMGFLIAISPRSGPSDACMPDASTSPSSAACDAVR
ncbi:hypothetical protein ACFB49_30960 [Sphingomonas sp. DBB INV C78]|uniref:hypothetical protein n=1 Tax=Sphingomonas sp. DBB INV C78 TaxID=3349434 RepID=UPI0036D35552